MLALRLLAAGAVLLVLVQCSRSGCPDLRIKVIPACVPCQQQFDSTLPRGTRVYAYDEYMVSDGKSVARLPSSVTFSQPECGQGIRATDTASGKIRTFGPHARIERNTDFVETALRPGEPMPADLRRALAFKQAYLRRTI